MKSKIINLLGAPGAGKTLIAHELFSLMKRKGINVEYVPEYAKELAWENNSNLIKNQIHVFAEQNKRLVNLLDKVDIIITDSPIILSAYYNPYENKEPLNNLIFNEFNKLDNYNYFINRGIQPYQKDGRFQNEDESNKIHNDLITLLESNNIEYFEVENNENSARIIYLTFLMKIFNKENIIDNKIAITIEEYIQKLMRFAAYWKFELKYVEEENIIETKLDNVTLVNKLL